MCFHVMRVLLSPHLHSIHFAIHFNNTNYQLAKCILFMVLYSIRWCLYIMAKWLVWNLLWVCTQNFFYCFFFYLLNHSTALADILSTLKLLHILCMYESNRGNCQYDNNNTQWTVCNGWNLKMKALEINHHFTFLMHACMHAAACCFFPFSFSSRCAEQTNKIWFICETKNNIHIKKKKIANMIFTQATDPY